MAGHSKGQCGITIFCFPWSFLLEWTKIQLFQRQIIQEEFGIDTSQCESTYLPVVPGPFVVVGGFSVVVGADVKWKRELVWQGYQ